MNKQYDLIIIGGGSAGVSCALSAYENGVKNILIIEKELYLGGILLQCIHSGFGLKTFSKDLTGVEFAHMLTSQLEKTNVEVVFNSFVTKIEVISDTLVNVYVNNNTIYSGIALVSATGSYERTRGQIRTPGTRPQGILTAGLAQKYINIEGYMVGKKVLILGSGDIGLIMARRLALSKATVVGVFEIMPYSSGLKRNIVQCLDDFNIPLYTSYTVKEVIGNDVLEKVVVCKVDNNFNFIENTEITYEVDTLLLSVGLIPYNFLLESLNVSLNSKTKGPLVNSFYQTSIKNIFSCGNSLHIHDLVDYVVSEAKEVGIYCSSYIKKTLNDKNKINIINKDNVSYVVPNYTYLNESFTLKFRVTKPFEKCFINIFQDEVLIKKVSKPFLIPSELETVFIDKNLIKNNQNIYLEVTDE